MASPAPPDPEDPLAPARGQGLDGLLVLLEQLDGAQEAAVVRSAIAAGVSPARVLDELQRGYQQAEVDPESGVGAMLAAEPSLNRSDLEAQLDAVAPAFTAGAAEFGQLRPAVLRAWARWDVKFGILSKPPDVARAFDTAIVTPPDNGN